MKRYDPNLFSTNDLALIAALAEKNFAVHSFEKNQAGKATFHYIIDMDLQAAISQYWCDEMLVNPRFYFDTVKRVKTRIYSGQ